jgi:hypothetical protein
MKFIKLFEDFNNQSPFPNTETDTNAGISFYDKKWESFLPQKITVFKGGKSYDFDKGNVLLNASWINIVYENHIYGEPNSLMFDVYYIFEQDKNMVKLNIDITYGDLMVCEFAINPPNKINVSEYTSFDSKFDPSNTEFAFDNNTLQSLVNYFNAFDHGIHLTVEDLKFLSHQQHTHPTN